MQTHSGAEYAAKDQQYFANARQDILPLLPARCERVLELGCGSGATLKWLKAQGLCQYAMGVELFEQAASIAANGLDKVQQGDVERMELDCPPAHFDLILCLDVLEHLHDPWQIMNRLVTYLKPGGRLIASIPNVRNVHALGPLLFKGQWRYADSGILDRTHLRFFTRESALQLVAGSGLQIQALQRLPLGQPGKSRLANQLTLGLFKDFLTLQYLIAADKAPGHAA